MANGVEYDEDVSPDSPFPTWIRTERLSLTPLHQTRASTLYNLLADTNPSAFKYAPFASIDTISDAFDLLEHATNAWHQQTSAFYLIRRREDSAVVGIAGLTDVDWTRRRLKTGILLHPSYWGNGYATERLLASYEIAFTLYDFEYVVSVVLPDNTQSAHAVEKAIESVGGERWGSLANEVVVNSTPFDAVQYVVSKEQYDIYKGDRRPQKSDD